MKKIIALLLTIVMVLSLTACNTKSAKRSLYEHGLDLISLIEEMAENEAYFSLYTANSEMQEIVAAVGSGDHSEPKAVYQITIAEDMISEMANLRAPNSLSESLQNYVAARTHNALVSQINAAGGAETLAAASICTASKTFASTELTGNTIYLYTYENGVPAIVTFTSGEDDTVSATSCFIFNESFKADTPEDVEAYFAEVSASVSVVEH